jgi:hypothetical protein
MSVTRKVRGSWLRMSKPSPVGVWHELQALVSRSNPYKKAKKASRASPRDQSHGAAGSPSVTWDPRA